MSHKHEVRVLYSETEIAQRVEAMAEALSKAEFRNLLVVAVLKGSFMFAADLLRAMHRRGMKPQVEFVTL